MTLSTTNYELFKLRSDNREKIDLAHVRRLANSIKAKNMLDMKPMIVNEDMEIIDGQHRFMAARELKVPIFYKVERSIAPEDIVKLGYQKQWRTADYVNFWAKNGKIEFQKLVEFCKKSQLHVTIGIALICGRFKQNFESIRDGTFIFTQQDSTANEVEYCHQIIDIIKQTYGDKQFLRSAKMWKGLINIIKDPHYNHVKMINNIKMLIARIGQRPNYFEYLEMFCNIHNYRNQNKITINQNKIEDGEE